MKRLGAGLLGVAMLMGGCAYYNSIYNAERSFDEGERHRRAGRDSLAVARYRDVVRKAAEGYRRDPTGQWADDALFLVGRAQLRLGELRAARAALERAAETAETDEARRSIRVYLAVAESEGGNARAALGLVNEALGGLREGPAMAEAHLLRGRILLSGGNDAGWWDLDRAPEVDVGTRVEAAVERLHWALANDQVDRAEEGFARLLSYPEASEQIDTVAALAHEAAELWSREVAARLLSGVTSSSWDRTGRSRVTLVRADLLHSAGDTAAASAVAWAAAEGIGEGGAEARLRIATWRLETTDDLADLEAVEEILLPAADHPGVETVIGALDAVRSLASVGFEEPLAWFAAAETARDELGAGLLARGLFLAYADADRDAPWVAKALLAAVDTSPGEGDRAWLRGRLEAFPDSPYVLVAHGRTAPGFEALEQDLALRLRELRNR